MAFGGVPIDRNNRDKAVKAIGSAVTVADARNGDCLCIAPEGTRSKSGQIMIFKKGPFYMWEQMKIPIIPLMIFGAFELYPPGKQMTIPGKVYARFLDPILPHEASSREDMSNLLRRRMLKDTMNAPSDIAVELTWSQRLQNWLYLYGFFWILWYAFNHLIPSILRELHMSVQYAWICFTIASVVITIVFYIYLVYLSHWLTPIYLRIFPHSLSPTKDSQ